MIADEKSLKTVELAVADGSIVYEPDSCMAAQKAAGSAMSNSMAAPLVKMFMV
jgi:hypothetical protein